MNSSSIKNFIINYVLICIILIYCLIFFVRNDFLDYSFVVILSFIINIIYTAKKLFWNSNHEYSLYVIFWIFNLLFMSVAPLFQYLVQNFALKNVYFNNYDFLQLNIYMFIYMNIFNITYKYTYRKKHKFILLELKELKKSNIITNIMLILFILAFTVNFVGINNLFMRYTYGKKIYSIDYNLVNFIAIFLEVIIYSACFLIIQNLEYYKQKKHYNKTVLLFSFIPLLMIIFPTSRARFIVGTVYLGMYLNLKRNFKRKKSFIISILLMLIIVLPIFSAARSYASLNDFLENANIKDSYYYLIYGDFSAYTMALAGIKYVKVEGYMYGKQMISNLLFFVPRKLWPQKMVSLGATIADYFNHTHNNMDSPLIIEFYVDFGIIGLILFTILLAIICARTDLLYWETLNNDRYLHKYIYPFIVIIFIFINRGAFMSTFSRMVNILVGFLLVTPLYYKKIIKKIIFKHKAN